MDNTHTLASSKEILRGTLLAQAKLLGYSADLTKKTIEELHNIVISNIDDKVSTIPSVFKPQVQTFNVLQPLQDFLESKSKSLREGLSRHKQQLLDKAYQYGIELQLELNQDFTKVNFTSLADKVYEWEDLLERANDLSVAWHEDDYDVVGLEQEIEDYEARVLQEQKSLYSDFLATRGV